MAALDWIVVVTYLAFALCVGLWSRDSAGQSRKSYFVADRSLPWWWAGTSIAATTFAADTPLAITGIVFARGVSGNWVWLSWLLVHAGVVMVFARRWWSVDVVTDAEFIALRYRGRSASVLRSFRTGLYGLVYNVVILGWVLRAMGKILHPLLPWEDWAPGLVAAAAHVVPARSALGGPGEAVTVILLVTLVAVYSSLGGIRGVIKTDLVQFALGLLGSVWLAVVCVRAAGGLDGVVDELVAQRGAEAARAFLSLWPDLDATSSGAGGFSGVIGGGAFGLGAYLLVQSFANVPADGGGYLQQRLSATRSPGDAQKAAGLFFVLQYVVRLWPWLVVALCAVVLVPEGAERAALGERLGSLVSADREMAYPALMIQLLPPGVFGLLVVSLLAAFMSTLDTHFNWGASYVVSDVALRVKPDLSAARQVALARAVVVLFAGGAVLVAFQIERIEQAWRWVAALGAALGLPTLLRWLWWRVTAAVELGGAGAGLLCAAVLWATQGADGGLGYEAQLVAIAGASALGLIGALLLTPPPADDDVQAFVTAVKPLGAWPDAPSWTSRQARGGLLRALGGTVALVAFAVAVLQLGVTLLLGR